ncbi:DUF1491 family protein [Qipengyuania sp. JC766]|uniref:DUF1491 family protein n=1 Tax=Qipengyuania sp. JC766 TaxID=3232139 RepID=UPI0034598400
MTDDRLPAHLEVGGLVRAVQAAGGFATVLSKGERDAGTIALVLLDRHGPARFMERMPQLDGSRIFTCTREQDTENAGEFDAYVSRRAASDPDLWVVELDVASPERFAAMQQK